MISGYEKMLKSSIRNMEREDIEIGLITLKLIFWCNLHNRSGSFVCPPALQPVLDISEIRGLSEKFVDTLSTTKQEQ